MTPRTSSETSTRDRAAPLSAGFPAVRVLEARLLAARRTLRSAVTSALLNPLLYLLAMGLGIGAVADPSAAADLPGGSYLAFLAPGLLVASAMQLAASESLWPLMVGLEWNRTYHAVVATPLRPVDLVLGNLAFVLVRAALAGMLIALVIVVLGAAPIGGALAAGGVAVLGAGAVAAPIAAFTAKVRSHPAMTALMRFGIVPLFLFSGTFFPIENLPAPLQAVAPVSPLWHGAELARLAALGAPTAWHPGAHTGILVGLLVGGAVLAERPIRAVLCR